MAESQAKDGTIVVCVTPAMEREYVRRGMFPELRLDKAERISNGATGVYRVSLGRAAELLADAQAMRQRAAELPKGIPKAYSSLARNLAEAIRVESRRDAWVDPGLEEGRRRLHDSPARFAVGEPCLYFRDEGTEYGAEATVVGGYDLYTVLGGPYIDAEGERFSFMYGYLIALKGCKDTFICCAHQLTRDDCRPSHIRLVASASASRAGHGAWG